jgi:hypothetical protein
LIPVRTPFTLKQVILKMANPAMDGLRGTQESECSSCEGLWLDYRRAMIAHLEAVDELELSQFMPSARSSFALETAVLRAVQTRDQARLAAVAHEKSHGRLRAA